MKQRLNLSQLLKILCVFLVLTGAAILAADRAITAAATGKLYDQAGETPLNKAGLLLGTGKYLNGKRLNPYYTHRIKAAAHLIKARRIRQLIISGDNSRRDYNEPQMMKEDLVRAGVDSSRIFLDYAGFRTFDSMVRLKTIFSVDSVTVISQKFHNERALYIAGREGIHAVAFNAPDLSVSAGLRTMIREKFARVKLFIDYLANTRPKYLGKKIHLPD